MIKEFNRPICRQLRGDLEKVLANAGIEGVTFDVGNMSFSNTECKIKIVAKTEGFAEKNAADMTNVARIYGLADTTRAGWTLVDYTPRRRKYPFLATNPEGKTYKLSLDQAHFRFGRSGAYDGGLADYGA